MIPGEAWMASTLMDLVAAERATGEVYSLFVLDDSPFARELGQRMGQDPSTWAGQLNGFSVPERVAIGSSDRIDPRRKQPLGATERFMLVVAGGAHDAFVVDLAEFLGFATQAASN